MKKTLLVAACVALTGLTACQTTQPVSMTVNYAPTDPTVKNGDVLASARAQGQDIPALRGTEFVTVRTYHYELDKGTGRTTKTEMTGTDCNLESDGYTAGFQTPAEVKVPNYGYASRPISVKCIAEGYKVGIKSVAAQNETRAKRYQMGSSAGLVGVLAAAVIDAADSNDDDIYKYPPIDVVMNRQGCEKSIPSCRSR